MSSWSAGCDSITTLSSASPEPNPTISSPAPPRRDPHSRSASLSEKKRKNKARLPEDPAVVAACNARAADEFYKVQREWGCYHWRARPKSRREELQRLPALCNDFESFDKQMAYNSPEDHGLHAEIRAEMHERRKLEMQKEREARMQPGREIHARMMQRAEALQRDVEKHLENISVYEQNVDRLEQRMGEFAHEVREYGVQKIIRGRMAHQIDFGRQGRHSL
ncbi:hypothetical protein DENSPDRAFT_164501 [Dentipellis sp. KUC8613]|nr:hypothetical protein DENSPDRAFT_164501 [Dentipellis sp. KUC8613]